MPKIFKKQPAKKRGRPAKKTIKPKRKITLQNYEIVPIPAAQKDTELQSLTQICSMMDNFSSEQKQRILKFLCGRYYDFM